MGLFSDSHCHLDRRSADAIEKAIEAGVELVLASGIDISSSEEAIEVARKHPVVKACVGIHPWNADQYGDETRKMLEKMADQDAVVAVSEIGLDYVGRRNREGRYVNEYIDERTQRKAFRDQLAMARRLGLPVIVHDRTLDQEILDILQEAGNAEIGAAIHGFSKDSAYAERCVDLGIYLSVGQRAALSPDNEPLREAVRATPMEWLLTETDSGSPDGVRAVAEKIAELKDLTTEEAGRRATGNLRRLIGL